MVKNTKNKIMLLIIVFLFLLILPNYANAAKVSVGKVKGVKIKEQNTTSLKISWNSVSKVNGYKVYICDNSENKFKYYGKTTSKSMIIKKLKSSKEYKIKIRGYKTVKKKTYYGSYSSILKVATKPTQVKSLKVKSQTDSTVKLSWSKVTRASGYRVYIYNSSKKKYEYYGYSKTNSIIVKDLKSAQTYKIKVRAYKTVDGKRTYGSYSSVLTTTTKPAKVKNVKVDSQSESTIKLKWDKVSRATGYRVYKYNSSEKKYEFYGETKDNNLTIEDLKSAEVYEFKVKAYKTLDKKKYYGSYCDIFTTATKPTVVKDTKVISQTDTTIDLTWSKVTRATGYRVYIYNPSKDSYDYYGESKTTSIKIENLIPASIYKIKVRAYKQAENTKILSSNPKNIIETITKPSKVLNFQTLNSDSSSIKFSWDAISGVTGYKLYIYNSLTKEYDYYGKTNKNYITVEDLDYTLEYKFKIRAYKTFEDVQYFGSYSNVIDKRIRAGIDVSKWQTDIDWKAVKDSGVEFAMIRAGYAGEDSGKCYEDPYFKNNIEKAIEVGMEVGVYFFSYAKNEQEAEIEAKWVVDKLKEYEITGCKYIAYDFESWNKNRVEGVSVEQINNNTKVFLKYVLNQGYTPILYGNKYDLTERFETDEIVSEVINCKVWLAQYNSKVTYNGKYHMWQYTSEGSVDGILADVDLNRVYF